jgi:hypothetical protein
LWSPPRWLWLLLVGAASGAGGAWALQTWVLPPRLTAHDSQRLVQAHADADQARHRLAQSLQDMSGRLDSAQRAQQALAQEAVVLQAELARLQGDLASVVAALPPDPAQRAVEVRAARFADVGGALSYDVVLTRASGSGKPMTGQMQLVVTGASAQDPSRSIQLQPIALSLGRHEVLRGRVPLPAGFRPQQTTVRIVDRPQGQLLGQRVLVVR